MKKYFIVASILLLAISCSKQPVSVAPAPSPVPATAPTAPTPAPTAPTPAPPYSQEQLPVKYDNKQYGFIFSLPQDWKGFSIIISQWTGCPLDGRDCFKPIEQGPEIHIVNPKETATQHYEGIPIMVFTTAQWDLVQQEKMSVSAAPFGPSEFGHNSKYVFALPPRFDYDFKTDYQEVENIVQSQPLKAY